MCTECISLYVLFGSPGLMTTYPRPAAESQPRPSFEGCRATAWRHPKQPLMIIPHTLSELTGPHAEAPIGERIIVDDAAFNRLFLDHARRSFAAGPTPLRAMESFTAELPEKLKGYALGPA